MNEPKNEEAMAYLLGKLDAYNDIRINFWGFGYDNDETGQRVRKITTDRIMEVKEILEIDYFGEKAFSSVKEFLKDLKKD